MPDVAVRTSGLVLQVPELDAVTGAIVVVTAPGGHVVAVAETGTAGEFSLMLPPLVGLELSLPGLGIAGIAITAGESLLVLVR